jgi:porphobilinogen synthase
MLRETTISTNDLIYPVFVEEEIAEPVPIGSMPGIFRIPERELDKEIKRIANAGVKSIILFGVSHHKDATGSDSTKPAGLLSRMIARSKEAVPSLVVIADACLCEYTDHGHCGVLHDGAVANDRTLENLGLQAVIAARAGADVIAPSAMMDGQVFGIRQALDASGFSEVPVMAYSSKFASSMYGPFREAAGSTFKGDRKSYQMDPMNGREAIRESLADEAEGADILMVKPGLAYLDVLFNLRQRSNLPIAAYQVSGEYAMIKFAAHAGAIDEKLVVRETLGAFKRAGANLILSYFALDVAREGFDIF